MIKFYSFYLSRIQKQRSLIETLFLKFFLIFFYGAEAIDFAGVAGDSMCAVKHYFITFIKNKFGANKKNDLHLCQRKQKTKMKNSLIYRQNMHQPGFTPLYECIGLC